MYLQADCISLLYLAGFSMYSALKVAMASDHANNMTTIWKNVYAAHGGETSKKASDSQDITVEDIEESTDDMEIAEEGAAGKSSFCKSFVSFTTNAHFPVSI